MEFGNAALRRRHHALAQAQMSGDADLPRQNHVVFDDGAAGHADLRRENHAPADADAVRDVHQVVDLRAGLNSAFRRRPAGRSCCWRRFRRRLR